jgi:hypothetical protein
VLRVVLQVCEFFEVTFQLLDCNERISLLRGKHGFALAGAKTEALIVDHVSIAMMNILGGSIIATLCLVQRWEFLICWNDGPSGANNS